VAVRNLVYVITIKFAAFACGGRSEGFDKIEVGSASLRNRAHHASLGLGVFQVDEDLIQKNLLNHKSSEVVWITSFLRLLLMYKNVNTASYKCNLLHFL
jgi:hypothetical protein